MSLINQIVDDTNTQRVLLQSLRESKSEIYLYGAGVYAYVLNQFLKQNEIEINAAIIDVEYIGKQVFIDLPIQSTSDFLARNKNAHVIVGVTNYPPIVSKLEQLNFPNIHVIDIPDYLNMPHRFMSKEFVESHRNEFELAYSSFEDELSRETYIASINTKISENLNHIRPVVRLDHIYFPESEFALNDKELFLDVGGFTGDTVEEFHHNRNGQYKEIISLEPSDENFNFLQKKANQLNSTKITPIKIGAWHEKTLLRFKTKKMHIDNEISETGEVEIKVNTIDAILSKHRDKITLMKIDINGAEFNALQGARTTLQTQRPKIIVRLHRKEDYFRIPLLLKQFCPDIKLYLRQRNYMSMMLILYANFD